MSNNLKVSDQCTVACKKVNMMLGLISSNFDQLSPEVMKRPYSSFMRPHLEYKIQFWSPNYIKDFLEEVQTQVSKHIPTLRNLSYEGQLKHLDVFLYHK